MDVQRLRLDTRSATSANTVAAMVAGVGRILATQRITTPPGRFYSFYRAQAGIELAGWRGRLLIIDGNITPAALAPVRWFAQDPTAGPAPSALGVGLVAADLEPPPLDLPGPDQSTTVVIPPGAGSTVLPLPTGGARLYGLSGLTTANASELDIIDAGGSTLYTAPGFFGLAPFDFGGYYVPDHLLPLTVTTLAGYPGGRVTLNYSAASIPAPEWTALDTVARFQTVPGDKITAVLVGAPEQAGLQYVPGAYLTLHGIDTDLALTRWS